MAQRQLTFAQSVGEGILQAMERDTTVFMIGHDIVGRPDYSEVARAFSDRMVDAPICEDTIVGSAVGASLLGLRPIVELHNSGFVLRAMDQIVNEAAKMQYVTGGQTRLPLVIKTAIRTRVSRAGATHCQDLTSLYLHTPGLQVVTPSDPYDAKGLLISAIRGRNPVIFFEWEGNSRKTGPVPKEDYSLPFGRAAVRREGGDVTVVSDMCMMDIVMGCAEVLRKEGIDIEVLDLRTLVPLDRGSIMDSVRKTGHLVIVEQGPRRGGIGAEISAVIAEEGFDYLDGPIRRVAGDDVPIPYSKSLEAEVLPSEDDVLSAVREAVGARSRRAA